MNSFIPKSIAALTGFAMILGLALPVSAVELVVVSWGGAYTASQQKAYHDPYMKMNPSVRTSMMTPQEMEWQNFELWTRQVMSHGIFLMRLLPTQ